MNLSYVIKLDLDSMIAVIIIGVEKEVTGETYFIFRRTHFDF